MSEINKDTGVVKRELLSKSLSELNCNFIRNGGCFTNTEVDPFLNILNLFFCNCDTIECKSTAENMNCPISTEYTKSVLTSLLKTHKIDMCICNKNESDIAIKFICLGLGGFFKKLKAINRVSQIAKMLDQSMSWITWYIRNRKFSYYDFNGSYTCKNCKALTIDMLNLQNNKSDEIIATNKMLTSYPTSNICESKTKYNTINCKNGDNCYNKYCTYGHSTDWIAKKPPLCNRGVKCNIENCKFEHEDGI